MSTLAELLNLPGSAIVLLNATTSLSRKLLSVFYSVESVQITATESAADFPLNATAYLGHLYLILFSAVYSGKATEVFRLHLKDMNARDTAQPAIVAMILGDKVTSPTASPTTNQAGSDGGSAKANKATVNTALIAGILAGTLGLLCAGIPLFIYFRQESKKKQKQAREKDNLKVVSNSSTVEDEKVLVLVQQSPSDLYPNLETVVRSKTTEEPNNKEETPSFANYYDLFADNDDDRVLLYSNLKGNSESHFRNPLLLKQSRTSLENSKCLTLGSELFTLYNVAEDDGGFFSESRTGENPQHKNKALSGMSDPEKSPEHPFHVHVIENNNMITSSKSTPMRPPKAARAHPSSDPVGLKRSKLLLRSTAELAGSSDSDESGRHFAVDRDMPHSQRFRVIQTKFEYMIQKNSRSLSRVGSPMDRESKLMSMSIERDGSRSRTGSFSTDRAKVFSSSAEKDLS